MVSLNFFGHNDPAGNSPDDRRKKAGVSTPIRENLGKASDLPSAEVGLMRSPVHRDAILDPEMTRVGLGIAKDAEGYLLVTQNYSAEPVSANDLLNIQADLINSALNAANSLANDATLKSVATDWSKLMVAEDFFGSSNPANGKSIQTFAQAAGIRSALQINIVKATQKKSLSEELLKQDGLKSGTGKGIGIGLAISAMGEFYMTVIYSQ
jgi:uncharacterized protein YkwD